MELPPTFTLPSSLQKTLPQLMAGQSRIASLTCLQLASCAQVARARGDSSYKTGAAKWQVFIYITQRLITISQQPYEANAFVMSLKRKMRFRESRRFIPNHTTEKNSPGFCLEAGDFAKSTLRQLYENYHIKM